MAAAALAGGGAKYHHHLGICISVSWRPRVFLRQRSLARRRLAASAGYSESGSSRRPATYRRSIGRLIWTLVRSLCVASGDDGELETRVDSVARRRRA